MSGWSGNIIPGSQFCDLVDGMAVGDADQNFLEIGEGPENLPLNALLWSGNIWAPAITGATIARRIGG